MFVSTATAAPSVVISLAPGSQIMPWGYLSLGEMGIEGWHSRHADVNGLFEELEALVQDACAEREWPEPELDPADYALVHIEKLYDKELALIVELDGEVSFYIDREYDWCGLSPRQGAIILRRFREVFLSYAKEHPDRYYCSAYCMDGKRDDRRRIFEWIGFSPGEDGFYWFQS